MKFVDYVTHMGTDELVVDAARVSFHKLAANYTEEQNARLIQYLAKHKHWSCFAHPQITLRLTVPIFVARQEFKHIVGFVRSEISRRYVSDTPEFYIPDVWRSKPEGSIKQGSGDDHPKSDDYSARYAFFMERARALYEDMIFDGIAPEQARMVLPQSMITLLVH